jgi:hypothetical protein
VTLRSTLVVLTLAGLSACNARLARQETAVPKDGASVADARAPDARSQQEAAVPKDAASVADAGAPDATLHDASISDAGSNEAASTDACPAVPAVSCGLAFGPCAGCCVDDFCVGEGYQCGKSVGVCHGSSCSGTGGLGQACVNGLGADGLGESPDGSPICGYWQWTGCTEASAACVDGGCVHCGLAGEPCCDQGCGPHTYCDSSQHCNAACGALGQTCCQTFFDYACDDGGACLQFPDEEMPTCVPGSSCHADAGSCTTCGSQGQPCCDDGGCNANGRASCFFGDAGCMQINMK